MTEERTEERDETQVEEATEGTPIALPPEQVAAFQEAVAQAQAEELEAEEEEPTEDILPITRKPSRAAIAAERAAERAGLALGGVLRGVGEKIYTGEQPKGELDDLFEGPQETDNDIYTADLLEVSEEDVMGDDGPGDMSDLLEVDESVLGLGEQPEPKPATFRRTRKTHPAPRSIRGIGI